MTEQKFKIWVTAFRLRTLPLAVASIILGSFLAASAGGFQWRVAILCSLTALLLQVLSNLANDYGDAMHGADSKHRIGPQRVTQSGLVSKTMMRIVVLIFVTLCLTVGYLLIRGESIVYYILGIGAILAAVAYTAGPKPYGYAGFGDVFVFLFFGLVGVFGTYYLHTHQLDLQILLPAAACGFFCVGVLNINNIRDIQADRLAGKQTIPVRIGAGKAMAYHWFLLLAGISAATLYVVLNYGSHWRLLFLLTIPLLLKNGISIIVKNAAELDPLLKQMAIATLLFSLSFGLGAWL